MDFYSGFCASDLVLESPITSPIVSEQISNVNSSIEPTIECCSNDSKVESNVPIETKYHIKEQGVAGLFMDEAQHILDLAFAVGMGESLDSEVERNIKSITNNHHTFKELVLKYTIADKAKRAFFTKLIAEFADAYKDFFDGCVDLIINWRSSSSAQNERKIANLMTDNVYDKLSKIYYNAYGESAQNREKMRQVMVRWQKYSKHVCNAIKKTLDERSEMFRSYSVKAEDLAEKLAVDFDEVFKDLYWKEHGDYEDLTLMKPFEYTSSPISIEGIYKELIEHLERTSSTSISTAIQHHTNDINKIYNSIHLYCNTYGIDSEVEVQMKNLITYFSNYYDAIRCAKSLKDIEELQKTHKEEASSMIQTIASKISIAKGKTPSKKDELARNWKKVHNKLTEIVASSKKVLSSATSSLFTYLKGSKGQTKLQTIHSHISDLQISARPKEPERIEAPKKEEKPIESPNPSKIRARKENSSWLSKQKESSHEKEALDTLAAYFASYSNRNKTLDSQNISEFITEISQAFDISSTRFLDQNKIDSLDGKEKTTFHINSLALQMAISSKPERQDQFVERWYDFATGGSLDDLLFKFCKSFTSDAEKEDIFDQAAGISQSVVAKLYSKKRQQFVKIMSGYCSFVISLFVQVFNKSGSTRRLILDLKEALGRIGITLDTMISAKPFTPSDHSHLIDKMYNYVEDLKPELKGPLEVKALTTTYCNTLVDKLFKQKDIDLQHELRSLARIAMGFMIGIGSSPHVDATIKANLKSGISEFMKKRIPLTEFKDTNELK